MANRSRSQRRRVARKQQDQAQHAQAVIEQQAERSSMAPRQPRIAIIDERARTNPFEPMERLMQAFMPFAWLGPWMATPPTTPKLDVIDGEKSVLVRAEVPGVQKSHLEIQASDTAVTIKGEVQHDEDEQDRRYQIAETSRGAFTRTVRLPSDVDSAKARATFKDGVVEVMLPKVDRSRAHPLKF